MIPRYVLTALSLVESYTLMLTSEQMYDRCRSALRLQLDLLADEKSVYSEEDRSAAATGAKAEEVRGWQSRVRAATKQLGKVLSGAPFAKE